MRKIIRRFSLLMLPLLFIALAASATISAAAPPAQNHLSLNFLITPPAPQPRAATSQPRTPTARPISASAFDMGKATLYKAPSDILEMKVPPGWVLPVPNEYTPYSFTFRIGEEADPEAVIQISFINTDEFYSEIDPSGKAKTLVEALNIIKTSNTQANNPSSPKFGNVTPGKLGRLDALILTVQTAGSEYNKPSEITLYAAETDGGKRIVYVQTQSHIGSDPAIARTMRAMLDTLVVKTKNIPTATITPTLHPLVITLTALVQQIDALTPTATPQP